MPFGAAGALQEYRKTKLEHDSEPLPKPNGYDSTANDSSPRVFKIVQDRPAAGIRRLCIGNLAPCNAFNTTLAA